MSEVDIDDIDASVVYAGNWQSSTDIRSYQNTIHFTNSLDTEANLTFTGISVMAYGAVRASETPQSLYTLDGGDPTFFQATSEDISQYSVLLYTSPILLNGQHNLVITNLDNESTLFLDYFIITSASSMSSSPTTTIITPISSTGPDTPLRSRSSASGSTTIPSTTGPSSSSSSSSSRSSSISSSGTLSLRSSESGSSTSVGDVPIPTSTASDGNGTNADPAPAAMSKNTRHIAAIIGGVAALAVVLCLIIVSLWLRRRRRKKKEFESFLINSFSGGIATRMDEELLRSPPHIIQLPYLNHRLVTPKSWVS